MRADSNLPFGRNYREFMFAWLKNLLQGERSVGGFSPESSLDSLPYTVVDTELTSLDSRSNRILSIGAVGMAGRKILFGKQFYRIINPGVPVPEKTVLIHGLRPIDISEGESPGNAIAEFVEFTRGTMLVGHFLSTDLAALRKEAGDGKNFRVPAIDTARIQWWLDRQRQTSREDRGHEVERVDLMSLAARYGLSVGDVHHALEDAFVTAQLWQRLMAELEKLGIKTLRPVLRASNKG
ncbi:MAG TPA: 3'-5' exonuclease [Candidatus Angelobacter sp.]